MISIKKLILLVSVLCLSLAAAAQSESIRGTILDTDGLPVIGAAVIIQGTSVGTSTDLDGRFILSVNPGQTIEISSIGFKTKTVVVTESVEYDILLEPDAQFMDEIVVVGYDTQKKVNLTGSVSSLPVEVMDNRPVVQASTALQGTMPGVTVSTHGGAPGDDSPSIRVRGLGTFGTSSSAPLVLIDGIEGDMNTVDANQIESISVLKDAASSAIYGSRAANGVILVTTKRASKEKCSVTYKGYVGWQVPTALPELVTAEEYMILSRMATENDGGTSIYTDSYIQNYRKNNYHDSDNFPITDWQKEILQGDGFTNNHNLTVNMAGERVKNVINFGYVSQNGIIKNTDFQRYNLRTNTDIQVAEKLSLRLDLTGSYGVRNYMPEQSSIISFMNARDPLMLARWSDGSYAPFTGGSLNVLPYLEGMGGNTEQRRINLGLAAELVYKPFKWWTISGTAAPRYVQNHTHAFVNKFFYHSDPYGSISTTSNVEHNSVTESQNQYYYGNYYVTTMFQHLFEGGHYAKILLGASNESMDNRNYSGYRQDFDYPEYQVLSAGRADETQTSGGTRNRWRLISFFARANYNFKERYLFEANVRFDGSSRFAVGKQWGVFPSVSAAWRVTEEPWMSGIKNTLTEFKIRASYGQLGNQNIGSDYYPTTQSLTISSISMNDIIYPILATNTLANEDITWEVSTMYDVGIDAAFWNKLTFTADAYHKITDNILLKLDIPGTIGLGAPYQNAGTVRNIGWEIGVGYGDTIGDWSWNIHANLADVYNKILDMKGTTGGSGAIRNQEGSSINSIYGYRCLGIAASQEDADYVNENQMQFGSMIQAGDLVYEDIAGGYDENGNPIPDGKIDANDRTIIGSAIPRLTYGLNLNVAWRGLALNVLFQGVGKADAYISGYYTQPGVKGGTFRKEHLDCWTPTNTDCTMPRMTYNTTNNTQTSTFWMGDASYMRLKNLQISYSLPSKWVKAIKMRDITLFANGENLFTVTNYYQGYDPENMYTNSGDGVATGSATNYPLVKTFTLGVDIKF